jgi:hypothetical protein
MGRDQAKRRYAPGFGVRADGRSPLRGEWKRKPKRCRRRRRAQSARGIRAASSATSPVVEIGSLTDARRGRESVGAGDRGVLTPTLAERSAKGKRASTSATVG